MEGPSGKAHPAAESIFNAAVALPVAQRAEYLTRACGQDMALRQEVEALLRVYEAPEGFLPEQPGADAGARAAASVEPERPLTERPGDIIGRYKLLEKLGEGGFGVVYVAEQKEPVKRQVALKIIKIGMDTRQVVGRFEIERQALALMDHPNIAKVLDSGATGTGRPYFVMELVRGVPLTEYCDQNNLSPAERLELFIQVCRAIQHAHQKGIIHRDIKPSNILVTLQDGKALPKVIDFGIAKATQGELTDKTVLTQFQQFIGTPAYMSPEQTEVSGLDIDTRSDIYSLGVLLYELLVGKTPFDPKELLRAGLDQMRRTIREQEPQRPSTRLSSLLQEELTTTARRRGIDGRKLISLLKGDLDWVAMKCLEKDRTRRYETANGLAMDIERYLAQEPVIARPPSGVYRLQKLVRRNKLVFAAGSAVAAALVLGVLISTWQAVRARRAEREQRRLLHQAQEAQANETRERQHAQTEAAKSHQVARLLKETLEGVGPSKALGRDTTMLREILGNAVENLGRELTNQPEVELELRATIADTFHELSLFSNMESVATGSLQLARTRLGEETPATAEALFLLGEAQRGLGQNEQAERSEREALRLRRKLLGNDHIDVANSLDCLAFVFENQNRLAETETAYREALAIRRKLLASDHPDVATSLHNLATVLDAQGKLLEAETNYNQALAIFKKQSPKGDPAVADCLRDLGLNLLHQRRLAEAESYEREALALRRRLLPEEHPHLADSLNDLGTVLRAENKLAEAESTYRELLALRRRILGNENSSVAQTLNNLGSALYLQRKLDESESMFRESLALARKLLGNEDLHVAIALGNLARTLQAAGKLAQAEAATREALAIQRKFLPDDHPDLALSLYTLASLLQQQASAGAPEKFAESEPFARECLAIREKKIPGEWQTFNTRRLLGASLLGQKKYAEAEPLLSSGYEGMLAREAVIPPPYKRFLRTALLDLALLTERTGRSEQAVVWREKLVEFDQAQTNKPPPVLVPAKASP